MFACKTGVGSEHLAFRATQLQYLKAAIGSFPDGPELGKCTVNSCEMLFFDLILIALAMQTPSHPSCLLIQLLLF